MNQVNIIGHIGSEPEVREFISGNKVMRFSLAVNSYGKDGKQKPATWIPCEAWNETADRLKKCSDKEHLSGKRLLVTGALALNQYERKLGDHAIKESKLFAKIHQFTLLSHAPSPAVLVAVSE